MQLRIMSHIVNAAFFAAVASMAAAFAVRILPNSAPWDAIAATLANAVLVLPFALHFLFLATQGFRSGRMAIPTRVVPFDDAWTATFIVLLLALSPESSARATIDLRELERGVPASLMVLTLSLGIRVLQRMIGARLGVVTSKS